MFLVVIKDAFYIAALIPLVFEAFRILLGTVSIQRNQRPKNVFLFSLLLVPLAFP
jgi:small neutral amino acid transporter SnatA (MarC family)